MPWPAILGAGAVLYALAARGRKERQRETLAALRSEFAHVARLRLVAACPALEDALDEASLRLLFDWMLIDMYRRTGTSGFLQLRQWAEAKGAAAVERLSANTTHDAVPHLPRQALAAIDACGGRTFAAVVLDEALTEAGRRMQPSLRRL